MSKRSYGNILAYLFISTSGPKTWAQLLLAMNHLHIGDILRFVWFYNSLLALCDYIFFLNCLIYLFSSFILKYVLFTIFSFLSFALYDIKYEFWN